MTAVTAYMTAVTACSSHHHCLAAVLGVLLDVLLTKLLSTGRARDTCGVTRALPFIKARARGRVSLYHGPGSNIVLIYR